MKFILASILTCAALSAWSQPSVWTKPGVASKGSNEGESYDFIAWPVGEPDTIRFHSQIYRLPNRVSVVRLGDGKKFFKRATERGALDFDSLKALRVKPKRGLFADTLPGPDSVWVKAERRGLEWVFPHYFGRTRLYGYQLTGTIAYMDTGSGLVPYSEAAYRTYLARDPATAEILKSFGILNKSYERALEAYDRGGESAEDR